MSCHEVKELRVGVFGGGVVGGGVCELVQKFTNNGRLANLGVAIKITKVCVLNLEKQRDLVIDRYTKFVVDYDEILKDSSIDCVVEVMGGVTHAKDVVFAAIKAGKHVITANKALIANYLPDIQQALIVNPGSRYYWLSCEPRWYLVHVLSRKSSLISQVQLRSCSMRRYPRDQHAPDGLRCR